MQENLVLSSILVTASAAMILLLGVVHLLYTFSGSKLLPRDPEVRSAMERDSPVITRQTTMWKAWVGFNASHSLGAILFGAVYGYLSLFHAAFLFDSAYLSLVGFLLLAGFFVLGRLYWFSVPYTGITIALVCYATGMLAWRL